MYDNFVTTFIPISATNWFASMIYWKQFYSSFIPYSFPYLDQATATPASKAKTTDHSFQCEVDTTDYISPGEAETTDYVALDIGKWMKSLALNWLLFQVFPLTTLSLNQTSFLLNLQAKFICRPTFLIYSLLMIFLYCFIF